MIKDLPGRFQMLKWPVLMVIAALSAHAMARYLQFQPATLIQILFFAAVLLIYRNTTWLRSLTRGASVVMALFSGCVAVSIIVGKHIVIGDNYYGDQFDNYIDSIHLADAFAFFGIAFVVFSFAAWLYVWLVKPAAGQARFSLAACSPRTAGAPQGALAQSTTASAPAGPSLRGALGLHPYAHHAVRVKDWLAYLAVLFVAWLPYLLVYWPGFVFTDTATSIYQAVGAIPWSNHHPVLFTLLLKGAMDAATLVGLSRTTGLALYSAFQMLCLGGTFAYLAGWMRARFGLRRMVCWALIVFCAFSPYVATFSIALWKDPLFTAAAIVLSLMLADVAFSGCSRQVVTPRFLVALAVTCVIMALLRNNGIYMVFACLFIAAIIWAFVWRKKGTASLGLCLSLGVAVLLSYVICGPVYTALGIAPTETVEAVGIPLNQMARVAAVGGDMTESDREYLDAILPLEQYAEKYRPCCTDLLKWDEEFNGAALQSGDFWGHWWSMLVRNPKEYVAAWIMQTYGFWTFNETSVAGHYYNIGQGGLRYPDDLADVGIRLTDYRAQTEMQWVFRQTDYSIPEGLLFWVIVYLALTLALSKRWTWLLALVPSGALVLTLLIASPAWYWPRYACLLQFLVPLYAVMFAAMRTECAGKQEA